MADERKRIIEQTASTEIFDDDWFIKDSALHNTTKISQAVLKQEILKDVKGVVELTQAEYDALPSSKLTDGILYAIKDSEDIIGNIENAINTLSGDIDDLEELVSTEMYNTAPMWSDASYTFDDLVVYGIDGRLYRCIVRNSTANQFVPSEWQATDIKAELYLLLQEIAPQFIASSQSYTQVYYEGNLVLHTNDYGVNTFYVCKQDLPQGDTEWVANHWEEVNTISGLSKYLMDKIAEAGQIDDVQVKTTGDYESVVDNKVAKIDLSNMLIEKSVPNLPQPIATFSDGSDLPLKSLTASIVPVQDLHGQDAPWVGGAGKNKLNYDEFKKTTFVKSTGVWENNGVTITATENDAYTNTAQFPVNARITVNEGETITLSWESTDLIHGLVYIFPNGGTTGLVSADNYNTKEVSYTVGSGITYITYRFGVSNSGETIHYKNIMARKSGNATFAPYSNICPISGWTEEVVTRCGKNWFKNNFTSKTENDITFTADSDGIVTTTGTASAMTDATIEGNLKLPVGNYILNGCPSGGGVSKYRLWVMDVTTSSYYNDNGDGVNFEIVAGHTYRMEIRVWTGYGNNLTFKPMIRLATESDATFEPYNPNSTTTTIPFTDGQGQSVEVFGGSVDVTEGKVTVTHYRNKVTSVTRSSSTSFYRNTTTAKGSQYGSRVKCDKFVSASSSSDVGVFINSSGAVRFNTEKEYASASEFLADYGGEINVVYERETPYDLTFQPTSIKSLDGENSVWASTGDVAKLEYIANATDVIANLEARVTALENQ